MSEEARKAKPWDIFNDEIPNVDGDTYIARMNTCLSCDQYLPVIHVCAECKCLLKIKCRLGNAECPLGKW